MKLTLNADQERALRAFLARCPDAESLSQKEYVLDLYDNEVPVTIDLVFLREGVVIADAAVLMYDEALEGWYMGERLEEAGRVMASLKEAGAFD